MFSIFSMVKSCSIVFNPKFVAFSRLQSIEIQIFSWLHPPFFNPILLSPLAACPAAEQLGGGEEKLGLLSRGGMEAVRPCVDLFTASFSEISFEHGSILMWLISWEMFIIHIMGDFMLMWWIMFENGSHHREKRFLSTGLWWTMMDQIYGTRATNGWSYLR